MCQILIQTLCQQWEKDQRGEPFAALRNQVPAAALVNPAKLKPSDKDNGIRLILEQRGDNRSTSVYPTGRFEFGSVTEIGTQLDRLLIYHDQPGWICWRLNGEFKQWNLADGWAALEYQHRYRVEELQDGNPVIYWLYERIVINVAVLDSEAKLDNNTTDNCPALSSFLSPPGLLVSLPDQF
jgi:hypothetical protein